MAKAKDQRPLSEALAGAAPPAWVRDAQEHYQRTGSHRIEDMARLLGDQTKGVSTGVSVGTPVLAAKNKDH